jgi:hypothetical protein
MIRDVHPGSEIPDPGSWILIFCHPGSSGKKAPDPGYASLLYIFTAKKLYTVPTVVSYYLSQ